jgi:hypothetical protein
MILEMKVKTMRRELTSHTDNERISEVEEIANTKLYGILKKNRRQAL